MLKKKKKAKLKQEEISNLFKSKQPYRLQINDVKKKNLEKGNIETKPKMKEASKTETKPKLTDKKQKTNKKGDEQFVRGIKHMVPKTWKK